MGSFLSRLVIIALVLAAVVGLVHMGGPQTKHFLIKLHGGR
jgi:hypothetical protein